MVTGSKQKETCKGTNKGTGGYGPGSLALYSSGVQPSYFLNKEIK